MCGNKVDNHGDNNTVLTSHRLFIAYVLEPAVFSFADMPGSDHETDVLISEYDKDHRPIHDKRERYSLHQLGNR